MSDWDKFVTPVLDAFDKIRELPQDEKRLKLWFIAKEALYELGVGEGFINENDHVEPKDLNDARARVELLNTKERLVYHLVRLVAQAGEKDETWTIAADDANQLLHEMGYTPGRRTFMMESGEPGLSARWQCACGDWNQAGAACVHCGKGR
jgi:hypothetical protein